MSDYRLGVSGAGGKMRVAGGGVKDKGGGIRGEG